MKALDTFLVYNQGGWDYGYIKNGEKVILGNCLKIDDAKLRLNYLLSKDSYWLEMYFAGFAAG
jgi:hypothetical protein